MTRQIPKKYGIENAMIEDAQILKTLDIKNGDLIRIVENGQTVTKGVAIVADTSLLDVPNQEGCQLYVIRICKPGHENEYSVGDDWTEQSNEVDPLK